MKRLNGQGLFVDDADAFSWLSDFSHVWQPPQPSVGVGEIMPDRVVKVVDYAANKSTSATLSVGATFTSQIDVAKDVDWIKIVLNKGQTYSISAYDRDAGGGTIDGINIVGLYDASGKLIPGTSIGVTDAIGETITFTASATNAYYVAVAANSSTAIGSYTVAAAVRDTVAPRLLSATPADEATKVQAGANITLTFSEKVHAGAGNLTLTGSNGSKIIIDMGDTSQVSYSGSTVTINPTKDLAAGVTYTVTLDADAVRDYSNNRFAGLASSTALNFTVDGVAGSGGGTVSSGTAREWNVMIYIAGDNNLESYGIADMNELESVLGLPSDVTITVLFDRASGYSTASGNWTDTRVGVLTYDGTNLTNSTLSAAGTSWGELDTGSGSTLTRFINWSSSTYAAENYGLIVWNHGGGIYGSAWDGGSSNDNLTIKETASAIAASSVKSFDVVAFDACLMQMAETVCELAPYAEYIVASEDYVPGNGFAYDNILSSFVTDSSVTGRELATTMVSTYVQEYAGYSGITLSAIDTSKVAELVKDMTAFDTLALSLSKTGADWTALKAAAASAYEFGADSSFYFADLKDFMTKFAASASNATLKSLANEIIADVSAAVISAGGTEARATGLAIYLPNGTDAVYSGYTDSNFSWASATRWDDMLAYL